MHLFEVCLSKPHPLPIAGWALMGYKRNIIFLKSVLTLDFAMTDDGLVIFTSGKPAFMAYQCLLTILTKLTIFTKFSVSKYSLFCPSWLISVVCGSNAKQCCEAAPLFKTTLTKQRPFSSCSPYHAGHHYHYMQLYLIL